MATKTAAAFDVGGWVRVRSVVTPTGAPSVGPPTTTTVGVRGWAQSVNERR